jgi:hypothetical protein
MNEHQKAKDYWKRALKNDPGNENLRLKIRQPASVQN